MSVKADKEKGSLFINKEKESLFIITPSTPKAMPQVRSSEPIRGAHGTVRLVEQGDGWPLRVVQSYNAAQAQKSSKYDAGLAQPMDAKGRISRQIKVTSCS